MKTTTGVRCPRCRLIWTYLGGNWRRMSLEFNVEPKRPIQVNHHLWVKDADGMPLYLCEAG
jgi:hypothetical protein